MCDHPIEALIGGADGITCRKRGKTFADFSALEKSRAEKKKKAKKEPEHE